MRQSNRTVLNVGAQLTSTATNLALGLLTARWLLEGLGLDDFGLLAVVGASVLMSSSIPGSLARSASRHMAFELGRGDDNAVREVFNTTLVLFLLAALASLALGMALRPLLFYFVPIPAGREHATYWSYIWTLAQWCVLLASMPMRAALTAAQHNVLLSITELSGRISVLISTLLIFWLPGDRLINYSFLMALLTALGCISPIIGCWRLCPNCQIDLGSFRRHQVGRIGRFAGWSLVENICVTFCSQSGVIILGAFFNIVVCGAYTLAQRAANCQAQFGGSIIVPVAPVMTGYAARRQHSQVRMLTTVTSKYLVYLNLLMWGPVIFEAQTIMSLWLSKYPPEAPMFTQLLVSTTLAIAFSMGFNLAMDARGEIGRKTLLWNLPQVLGILLAGLAFYVWGAPDGISPHVLPATALAVTVLNSLVAFPLILGREIGVPYMQWLRHVAVPCFSVMAISILTCGGMVLLMRPGFPRLTVMTAINGLAVVLAVWLIGSDEWERKLLLRIASDAGVRLGLVKGPPALPSEPEAPAPEPEENSVPHGT